MSPGDRIHVGSPFTKTRTNGPAMIFRIRLQFVKTRAQAGERTMGTAILDSQRREHHIYRAGSRSHKTYSYKTHWNRSGNGPAGLSSRLPNIRPLLHSFWSPPQRERLSLGSSPTRPS